MKTLKQRKIMVEWCLYLGHIIFYWLLISNCHQYFKVWPYVDLWLGIGHTRQGLVVVRQDACVSATAAQYGRSSIAKMLIEHGCSVNTLDRYLKSPLFVAVQSNDRELVKVLIRAGVSLKHKRFNGRSWLLNICHTHCCCLIIYRFHSLPVSNLILLHKQVHVYEKGGYFL